MKSCNTCGRELDDQAGFCDSCGARQLTVRPAGERPTFYPLPRQATHVVRPQRIGRRIRVYSLRIVMVLLVIVAAMGFSAGAVTFYDQRTTTTQRITTTSVVTSLQEITVTKTQLMTVTQTVSNMSITTTPARCE